MLLVVIYGYNNICESILFLLLYILIISVKCCHKEQIESIEDVSNAFFKIDRIYLKTCQQLISILRFLKKIHLVLFV